MSYILNSFDANSYMVNFSWPRFKLQVRLNWNHVWNSEHVNADVTCIIWVLFHRCFTDTWNLPVFRMNLSLSRASEHAYESDICAQAKKSHAEVSRACLQKLPMRMRARRGHLLVHVEVTCQSTFFFGLPCKRSRRNVLVDLSRRLFFGPRADEEAGRLRDEESKNFIMWICNAYLTVSPTLTATDTTVPGMGDLRNGDMSSWIRESINTLKDFLIFHQNWIYQW